MVGAETREAELVDQLWVVDGLRSELLIQSAGGSQVKLSGCQFGSAGDCTASAWIDMAQETRWEVAKVAGIAQGRFRRDARVRVGESFGMLFFYPESERLVWIDFGQVAKIEVYPPEVPAPGGMITSMDVRKVTWTGDV
jgi:hypothetical protein